MGRSGSESASNFGVSRAILGHGGIALTTYSARFKRMVSRIPYATIVDMQVLVR